MPFRYRDYGNMATIGRVRGCEIASLKVSASAWMIRLFITSSG